jgi:hypothetical protein
VYECRYAEMDTIALQLSVPKPGAVGARARAIRRGGANPQDWEFKGMALSSPRPENI